MGADAWFVQNKGHSIRAATYEEGRDAIRVLLERKRARDAARAKSTPAT